MDTDGHVCLINSGWNGDKESSTNKPLLDVERKPAQSFTAEGPPYCRLLGLLGVCVGFFSIPQSQSRRSRPQVVKAHILKAQRSGSGYPRSRPYEYPVAGSCSVLVCLVLLTIRHTSLSRTLTSLHTHSAFMPIYPILDVGLTDFDMYSS